jgi:hypothetical protein
MPSDEASAVGRYFLSYSRSDERFALRFAKDLRASGVAIWVDQLDIRPSEHWDRAIERAVRDCQGLVVILSPRSVASDNVADEISFAIDRRKAVLPVVIEQCDLPLRITRMHVINAIGNYDGALQQCLAEMRRDTAGDNAPREAQRPLKGTLDADVLATAKQKLTGIVGPIAGILVEKTAQRASSPGELYSLLSLHIDDAAERERFTAAAGGQSHVPAAAKSPEQAAAPAGGGSIAQKDCDRIASALTTYLGPIAPILAKRESKASASLDELRQRLAALIPDERERGEFLKGLDAP